MFLVFLWIIVLASIAYVVMGLAVSFKDHVSCKPEIEEADENEGIE